MATVVPYLNFGTSSRAAVEFYKTAFGGEAEQQADGERIVHLDFQAGGIHFMGSDLPAGQASLVVNCDSEDQLRDFYSKLVDGGHEVFAPTDSGWGAIVAHCTDRFGVTWMLNFDKPQT